MSDKKCYNLETIHESSLENECSNEKVEKVSFNKNLFGKLDEITQTIRKYYLVISFRKIFVLTFNIFL